MLHGLSSATQIDRKDVMGRLSFSLYLERRILFPTQSFGNQRYRFLRFSILIIIIMIPLILSLMFAEGMIDGITQKYILLQDGHIQIFNSEMILEPGEDASIIDDRIYSIDYVVSGYGIMFQKDSNQEIYIKGVNTSYFNEKRRSEFSLTEELPLESSNRSVARVYISQTQKDLLDVSLGDNVALVTIPGDNVQRLMPKLATVAGIYESGYNKIDESLIFMDIQNALALFDTSAVRSELIVDSSGADDAGKIIDAVNEYTHTVNRWATYDQFNRSIYDNFITSRQVILLVFIIILLVAGVYIANIAHEIVEDSKQSIAMLKVLGATNRQMIFSYFATIMTVTVISMTIGIASGLLLSLRLTSILTLLKQSTFSGLTYYLLDFELSIPVTDILIIAVTLLSVASIFTIITLRRIISISPLEVLQQD